MQYVHRSERIFLASYFHLRQQPSNKNETFNHVLNDKNKLWMNQQIKTSPRNVHSLVEVSEHRVTNILQVRVDLFQVCYYLSESIKETNIANVTWQHVRVVGNVIRF